MKQKRNKAILAVILAILLCFTYVPPSVKEVHAANNYNASAALAYASAHWNDGVGLCAEFVSRCAQAGGLNIGTYGYTIDCFEAIESATGVQRQDLALDSYGHATKALNGNKLAAGDIVIQWCYTDGLRPHIAICCGFDSSGRALYYAHNNAMNAGLWPLNSHPDHPGHSLGAKVLHISGGADSTPPIISNAKVTSVTTTGATIECDVTDNVALDRVEFPTWPTYKTNVNCTWYKPTSHTGNHYVFNMKISDFANFSGGYTTNIYAWDKAGNETHTQQIYFDIRDQLYKTGVYNGHIYSVFDATLRWTSVDGAEKNYGGHRVKIESAEEQNFVYSLINKQIYAYHIGVCDYKKNKVYTYSDGSQLKYTKWREGQPDSYSHTDIGNEYYVEMKTEDGGWNDIADLQYLRANKMGYILECDGPSKKGSLNSHRYELYNFTVKWTDAKEIAEKLGGHLVQIESAQEQNYIMSLIKGTDRQSYWMGVADLNKNKNYTYVNGKALTYSNWDELQPDSYTHKDYGKEYYGEIRTESGKWNDVYNDRHYSVDKIGFIVEYDPVEPTSVSLDTNSVILNEGDTYTLTATVSPNNAEDKSINWITSNSQIATVSGGKITAIKEGVVTITAKTNSGNRQATCKVTVKKKDHIHDWDSSYTIDKQPTCTQKGRKSIHCKTCSSIKDSQEIAALGHHYNQTIKVATPLADGSIVEKCSICGDEKSEIIHRMSEVIVSPETLSYNGNELKPSIVVKDDNGNTISSKYYSVTYKNNVNVGLATVIVTGKVRYSGELRGAFAIIENKNQPNTQQPKEDDSSKVKNVPGVGEISEDGKTLKDTDNVKYYVSGKLKNKDLKKNLKIADKKSGGKYKITKVIKKNGKVVGGNVTYMAPYNKNCTKATAGATVKLGGVNFKITALSANAFKNCKKLATFKAGGNMLTIGKNAFSGCSSLKSVTITSTKLKSIGTGAFKGTTAKTKFKVPKSKLTKYTIMILKAGASINSKITK